MVQTATPSPVRCDRYRVLRTPFDVMSAQPFAPCGGPHFDAGPQHVIRSTKYMERGTWYFALCDMRSACPALLRPRFVVAYAV